MSNAQRERNSHPLVTKLCPIKSQLLYQLSYAPRDDTACRAESVLVRRGMDARPPRGHRSRGRRARLGSEGPAHAGTAEERPPVGTAEAPHRRACRESLSSHHRLNANRRDSLSPSGERAGRGVRPSEAHLQTARRIRRGRRRPPAQRVLDPVGPVNLGSGQDIEPSREGLLERLRPAPRPGQPVRPLGFHPLDTEGQPSPYSVGCPESLTAFPEAAVS